MANSGAEHQEHFFKKVSNLPVMETALNQLNFLYLKTKEKNRFLEMAMNATEFGAQVAYNTAAPVVGKFDKQIEALNDLACNQLNKLEEKYPIITKPAEEVVKATKDYGYSFVNPVLSNIKSIQNTANQMTSFGSKKVTDKAANIRNVADAEKILLTEKLKEGKQKVDEVVVAGVEKVQNDAMTYTGNVMSCINATAVYGIDKLSKTYLGKMVVSSVDLGLDKADLYLDYYCPPDETERRFSPIENLEGVVNKALNITTKARRRLRGKVEEKIGSVQKKSRSLRDGCVEKIRDIKTSAVENPRELIDSAAVVSKSTVETAKNIIGDIASRTKNVVSNGVGLAALPMHITLDVMDDVLNRWSAYYKAADGEDDEGVDREKVKNMVRLDRKFWNVSKKVNSTSVQLVSYMIHLPKNKYTAAKNKILFVWSEINLSDEEILKRMKEESKKRDNDVREGGGMLEEQDTYERKFVATTRHALQQAKWLSDPIFHVLQLTNHQFFLLLDLIKHNFITEKIVENPLLNFSVGGGPVSMFSQQASTAAGGFQQLTADLFNNLFVTDVRDL
ncbi:hypothetical protein HELRODRAFT_183843 [Helobdella robusta]|uniref:Perilipin n=1 Tax=Helobdella robusta TaxID=6412 RepID=T1FK94_HELRO|nr:hypothetical protein HELRODRAFT_183843 [Helobdella robusta]ESO09797.1 hypothetical protein HELRODRAFT_183843 [Helobdella robusta]